MLFFLNTFDKHFPLKNKSLLTIFSSTMILSSRIYSVPPLFLPERIPLHTMRYHLIVTYPNQTSDTQSHKVAMFSKQSFFGWNRCISPQLPSVPMQTNQSSAEKESCVIVGRCADCVLQDKADCLKVFIHADMAFRAERIVKVYGEREESPEQRLRDKDKRRAAYHRFYTNMKWGYAENYHLTLDSGVLGIDRCVDIISGLY